MDGSADLKNAITLAKSGNKTEAAKVLTQLLKEQPENEAAWLWLATCLPTSQQKLYCLNQALAINPENQTTQKAIEKIKASSKKPAEETSPIPPAPQRPKSILIDSKQDAPSEKKKQKRWPWLLLGMLILAGVLIALLATPQPASQPDGVDGVYLSNIDTGFYNQQQAYYLLRFYPDGTVMGATILGTPDQVGDMWSVFMYQNQFMKEYIDQFPSGQYQLGDVTPDGRLIRFQLTFKYDGHPDYEIRKYSGYINDQETYLAECPANQQTCTNRYYQRIHTDNTLP